MNEQQEIALATARQRAEDAIAKATELERRVDELTKQLESIQASIAK